MADKKKKKSPSKAAPAKAAKIEAADAAVDLTDEETVETDETVKADTTPVKKDADKKKTAKGKVEKVKKPNPILKFLRELRSEIKKVVWMPKDQLFRSSRVVILAIIVISTVISLLDLAFAELLQRLASAI